MKIEKTERILNNIFRAVVAISITAVFLKNIIPDSKKDMIIIENVISETAEDTNESKQADETSETVPINEAAPPPSTSTAAQTEPNMTSSPESPPEVLIAAEPSRQTDIKLQGISIADDRGAEAVITEECSFEETTTEETDSDLININTADAALLMSLPGIGEVKSQAIIDYRNEVGLFSSIEEIMNVKGIGEKTFEKVSGLITV